MTYTSVEDLKKQMVPEDPSTPFANFYPQTLVAVVESPDRVAYKDANLNSLCPQVKPVGIREFLETWWKAA